MSIYSGFATREDEKNYNKLLSKLMTTLQCQILQLTQGQIPAHYMSKYQRIICKMQAYEDHKYLPPKFTELMSPLLEAMNLKKNVHNQSRVSQSKVKALEEVKQEEQQASSSRKIKSIKTEMAIKTRKSMSKYRRVPGNRSIITDMSEQMAKQNKTRSFSLFGNEQKFSTASVKSRGQANMVPNTFFSKGEIKMKNRYMHTKLSSTNKRLPKTKTAEGPRINKDPFDGEYEQGQTGKTMDQILKINKENKKQ